MRKLSIFFIVLGLFFSFKIYADEEGAIFISHVINPTSLTNELSTTLLTSQGNIAITPRIYLKTPITITGGLIQPTKGNAVPLPESCIRDFPSGANVVYLLKADVTSTEEGLQIKNITCDITVH